MLSGEAIVWRISICSAAVAVLTAVASLGAPLDKAQTITYVEEGGRRVFVNAEDHQLHAAAMRGGVAAALRVIQHRKRSLPGIEQTIETVGHRYGIDPELVHAVVEVESAWNPRARSHKGALGLMQLMPETATRFGIRHPFDPKENVVGGVRYLRFLLDRSGGDLRLALAAYNAGENVVAARNEVPPYPETQAYVEQVQTLYGKFGSFGSPSRGQIYQTVADGRLIFANY